MPGGDRTGPMGAGPMTGRGTGICAGYEVPGYVNTNFGRGFGGGRGHGFGRGFQGGGGGRGWRHQYYATGLPGWARGYGYPNPAVSPVGFPTTMNARTAQAEELSHLKEQASYFKGVLDDIDSRVSELQQQTKKAAEDQQDAKK